MLSVRQKNLWHRWKTIAGFVCPVPVIIPALPSQATTEFGGCCQILSPSCALSIPRLGILQGIGIAHTEQLLGTAEGLLSILSPTKPVLLEHLFQFLLPLTPANGCSEPAQTNQMFKCSLTPFFLFYFCPLILLFIQTVTALGWEFLRAFTALLAAPQGNLYLCISPEAAGKKVPFSKNSSHFLFPACASNHCCMCS